MKILLLLANSAIEEYFKKQKAFLDESLEDTVYFHSLNHNCLDDEVFKCVSNMKPDLIIYRNGLKNNKETLAFLANIKKIRPSCNFFILTENASLIFLESLYELGIYDFFIGKQINVFKIVEAIRDYWKTIESKRRYNKSLIEDISNDNSVAYKTKNVSSFVLAENLLPEGIISPGNIKRISLMYYNLDKREDVFKMKFSIAYYDEFGVEKTKSFEAFMDNPAQVIRDLDSFNFVEEKFYEDYRYLYSSYDIIYNDKKVHGNMNWNGLYKELCEYTHFDKMKNLSIDEIPYNISYTEFINLLDVLEMKKIAATQDNLGQTNSVPEKKKLGLFGKRK